MNTFLGFGREHIERHYRKTGQCVYLHLKRHVIEVRLVSSQRATPAVLVSLVLVWVMHFRHRPSPEWLKCTRSDLGLGIKSRCLDPNQSCSFSSEMNQKPLRVLKVAPFCLPLLFFTSRFCASQTYCLHVMCILYIAKHLSETCLSSVQLLDLTQIWLRVSEICFLYEADRTHEVTGLLSS